MEAEVIFGVLILLTFVIGLFFLLKQQWKSSRKLQGYVDGYSGFDARIKVRIKMKCDWKGKPAMVRLYVYIPEKIKLNEISRQKPLCITLRHVNVCAETAAELPISVYNSRFSNSKKIFKLKASPALDDGFTREIWEEQLRACS
ncbi:MAG: hypothetical protein NTZ80_03695 [Patescibacteria group bacterium]|nr:hypothetical protein [Patescibacteria group bacterium]